MGCIEYDNRFVPGLTGLRTRKSKAHLGTGGLLNIACQKNCNNFGSRIKDKR
jgi:hypothetical protein